MKLSEGYFNYSLILNKKKEYLLIQHHTGDGEFFNHENGFRIMFNFVRWFTGVTLILIHLKGLLTPAESHGCRTEDIGSNNAIYADCHDLNITSIPQDLGANLESLNISRNPLLTQLNENDLNNYIDLRELTMKELKIAKFSSSFFNPTEELQTLDISSTCFSEPIPELPKPITRIVVNSMHKTCSGKVTVPSMSKLDYLTEYESIDNNLVDFPPLPTQAPIGFIDLSKNPMTNLTYKDIAPFCLLSQLNLYGTDLGLQQHHNSCCGLRKWGEKFTISVFLECSKPDCDPVDFDPKSIDAYDVCVNTPAPTYFSFDVWVLNIFIGVAVLLPIGYLAFRYFKSNARKKHRELVEREAMQTENEGENAAAEEEEDYL